MAKAEVKIVCQNCGREFYHSKKCYSRSQADSYKEWAQQNITICPNCWAKLKKETKQLEINETKKEMNFPELKGTPNQIAWAEAIRTEHVKFIIEAYDKHIEIQKKKGNTSDLAKEKSIIDYMIANATEAHEWIENRDDRGALLRIYASKYEEVQHGVDYKSDEYVREPEIQSKQGTVEIEIEGNQVVAKYVRDDDFRSIVKKLGYSWDSDRGSWSREIDQLNGSIIDRAAEIGSKLLNAGFSIRSKNVSLLNKAVKAEYEPEQEKWITLVEKGNYTGWLSISTPTDKLYKSARKLPNSRWNHPGVVVKLDYYREVEDFAELNEYSISESAKAAITVEMANREIVKPKKSIVTVAPTMEEKLAEILNQGDDIINDLKD